MPVDGVKPCVFGEGTPDATKRVAGTVFILDAVKSLFFGRTIPYQPQPSISEFRNRPRSIGAAPTCQGDSLWSKNGKNNTTEKDLLSTADSKHLFNKEITRKLLRMANQQPRQGNKGEQHERSGWAALRSHCGVTVR